MIRHRPSLVRSRTARACGSSTAATGHAAGRSGSAGTAPSTRAAAACSHWPARSAVSWARVMARTRRCTRTRPSPAGAISEYRRSAMIAAPTATGSPSNGPTASATSGPIRPAGCSPVSSRASGTGSGARNASKRIRPAAARSSSARRDKASPSVAATSAGCPAASPRASRSACRARNIGR